MRMLLLMGADSEVMGFLSYIVLRFGYCKLESSCCNYSLDCCNPLLCGVSKSNLRMCLRIAWPPLQRYHRKPRASPPFLCYCYTLLPLDRGIKSKGCDCSEIILSATSIHKLRILSSRCFSATNNDW